MKPFQSRNPLPIGVVGLVVIVLGLTAALNTEKLPIIGAGTVYTAEFSEAAGLSEDDSVRVAGVKVGSVREVDLVDDHIEVKFKVKDAWVGDQSKAAIKIQTLLGAKYLALTPLGESSLDPTTPIDVQRTSVPYDVTDAFQDLSGTIGDLDTDQLAKSFDTLSETLQDTPDDVRSSLSGLSQLSSTIADRDEELSTLLSNTKQVSKTLSDRDDALVDLMDDSNKVLTELQRREEAISTLLRGSQELSQQLQGLVSENEDQLGPVLEELDQLTSMLHRNQDALAEGIQNYAPFIRLFTNSIGNGRWFDNYICGLLPPSVGPVNEKGCYQE